MSSIVVVGGGLAGLACAWRLRQAGHDVEVLEAGANAGAPLRTEVLDGYRLEHGPAAFGALDANQRALVSTLGLGDAMVPIEPGGDAVLRRGACIPVDPSRFRGLVASPLLSAGSKLRSARLVAELARQRGDSDWNHPERMAPHERADAATYLAAIAGVEARDFLFGPIVESRLGAALEECSDALARLALFAGGGAPASSELLGGMQRVGDALSAQVSVRSQTRVLSVETEQAGAVVRYRSGGSREGRVFADAVVVALPPAEASEICAKLTPDERGFLTEAASQRAIVVHLLLDAAPRERPFYTLHVPSQLGLDVARIRVESHKREAAPPGAGLLRLELAPRAIDRLWRMDDSKVGRRGLEAVERTPFGRLRPLRIAVHRDERAVPRFGAGSLARLNAFVQRVDRTPRLAFAGDHCVGPYTEAALTSGMRAASEIVREFSRR
jgi:oxygen-dependent protoporphyrinogen oxidase